MISLCGCDGCFVLLNVSILSTFSITKRNFSFVLVSMISDYQKTIDNQEYKTSASVFYQFSGLVDILNFTSFVRKQDFFKTFLATTE